MGKIEEKYRQSGRTLTMIGMVRDELQKGNKVYLGVPSSLVFQPVLDDLRSYVGKGLIIGGFSLEDFKDDISIDFETMTHKEYQDHKLFLDHSLISARFGKMIDQYFNFYL